MAKTGVILLSERGSEGPDSVLSALVQRPRAGTQGSRAGCEWLSAC